MVPITTGVPQGSIIGHLLYLLDVNDINNSCDGAILSFADATKLVCSNRLSLNLVKTKYIVLRPRHMKQNLSEYSIKIGNTVLSGIGNDFTVKSTNCIGMHLDENLT